MPATLRVLNVRDWRVYGITSAVVPRVHGVAVGQPDAPAHVAGGSGLALSRPPWIAGLVTVAAISLKPFIWPLGFWLLATRRWRAAGYAFLWGLALNLVAWAVVGSNEIHTYLRRASKVTDALWRGGDSMLASPTISALVVALRTWCWWLWRWP